jgi:hypothetical protein
MAIEDVHVRRPHSLPGAGVSSPKGGAAPFGFFPLPRREGQEWAAPATIAMQPDPPAGGA